MLFFMHGAGETGTDLNLLERATLPRFIREGLELPFVTVCPQCQEMWDVRILEPLLDAVIEKYNVDAARVYLTGSSMGGLGTWMLANVAADRVAAIAPICPLFIPVDPENFRQLPVWVFHGAMDSVVPIEETDRMVALLRDAGCDVKLTDYPDVDHDAWTPAYHDPESLAVAAVPAQAVDGTRAPSARQPCTETFVHLVRVIAPPLRIDGQRANQVLVAGGYMGFHVHTRRQVPADQGCA